jgi:hypothetical protein
VPPLAYDDPVTVPAGDIADNPYWKRDVRRSYAQLSTVRQADAVSLLTVGSQAAPKDDVLKIGQAGEQQLVAVKEQGEQGGLAALFEQDKKSIQGVLGANGLPPNPCNINTVSKTSQSKYQLDGENGYPEKYAYPIHHSIDPQTNNCKQIYLPHLCLIRPAHSARKYIFILVLMTFERQLQVQQAAINKYPRSPIFVDKGH